MTVDLQPGIITEIADELVKELQEELDWEVMMDIMKGVGYTHIAVNWPTRMNESQAHEIKEWCRANLTGHYQGRGPNWLFKSEQDATLFALRWL